ncbi:hypothetical protein ZEAMMB73_Zm00001d017602, partial [Zea mays]
MAAEDKETDSPQPPAKLPRLSCADTSAGKFTSGGLVASGSRAGPGARRGRRARRGCVPGNGDAQEAVSADVHAAAGTGAPGAHLPLLRSGRAGAGAPCAPYLEERRRVLLRPAALPLADGPGEPVLRLPQQHGAGARAVPAHGRQEVAVLPRRGAGPQVLRAARPPRPRPFKKACGSRRPGAQRGGRHQPRRRPRPPHGRRAPAARARPLPHQRPPRPQRRACHMSRALRADILGWASESRGETESAGITMSCACCDFFHSQKSQLLKKPGLGRPMACVAGSWF